MKRIISFLNLYAFISLALAMLSSCNVIENLLLAEKTKPDDIVNTSLNPNNLVDNQQTLILTLDTPAVVNISNVSNYDLSGTCSELLENVTVTIQGLASISTTCLAEVWSISSIDLSSLADSNSISIEVTHQNSETEETIIVSATIQKDTVSLTVSSFTCNSGSAVLVGQTAMSCNIQFSEAIDQSSLVISDFNKEATSIAGTTISSVTANSGANTSFTISITGIASNLTGHYILEIDGTSFTDAVGNPASGIFQSTSIVVDTDAPQISGTLNLLADDGNRTKTPTMVFTGLTNDDVADSDIASIEFAVTTEVVSINSNLSDEVIGNVLPWTDITTSINGSDNNNNHNPTNWSNFQAIAGIGPLAALTLNGTGATGVATLLPARQYYISLRATDSRGNVGSIFHSSSWDLCPENYAYIYGNSTFGSGDFCVMVYEAKAWEDTNTNTIIDTGEVNADGCSAGCATNDWGLTTHQPVSVPEGNPWRRISSTSAKTECTSLGTGHDLISNPEWMTIAREIEALDSNWLNIADGTPSTVGVGCLKFGNSGHTASFCSYNGDNPESGTGRNTLARHEVNNGQTIWDFAGNIGEWTDFTIGGAYEELDPTQKAYRSAGGGYENAWLEWNILDTNIGIGDVMNPNTWQASNPAWSTTEGIGAYYAGTYATRSTMRRGSDYAQFGNVGIYAMTINSNTGGILQAGFRCVYRP